MLRAFVHTLHITIVDWSIVDYVLSSAVLYTRAPDTYLCTPETTQGTILGPDLWNVVYDRGD